MRVDGKEVVKDLKATKIKNAIMDASFSKREQRAVIDTIDDVDIARRIIKQLVRELCEIDTGNAEDFCG